MSSTSACLGLLLLCFAATANAQTQGEMNAAACDAARAADDELNIAYQRAMARWSDADTAYGPGRTPSLRTAQRAWLVFRDAHLDALFPAGPEDDKRFLYGSMYPMLRCGALEALTRARTEQLLDWVECEGGPSCIAGRG